jgi:hypothetical protein
MTASVSHRPVYNRSTNNGAGGKCTQREPCSVISTIPAATFVVTTVAVVVGLVPTSVISFASAPVLAIASAILYYFNVLPELSDLSLSRYRQSFCGRE